MTDWKRFVDPEASSHLQTRLNNARVFIAIDTSGSTEFDLGGYMNAFESERQFAVADDRCLFPEDSTSRDRERSSLHISKWGSTCSPPLSRAQQLAWNGSLGGTQPSQIFEEPRSRQCLLNSDFWCLFTDGEVDDAEVLKLYRTAKHHGALAIPVIILITGCKSVHEANFSVGSPLFANAPDAIILYKRIGTRYRSTRIYAMHAKGRFSALHPAGHGGGGNEYPEFSNDQAFWSQCIEKRIQVVRAEDRSNDTPGVQIATSMDSANRPVAVTIDIGNLVATREISQSDLESIIAPQVFNDIALAAKTQGQMDHLRSFLEKQRPRSVVAELQDLHGASSLIMQSISATPKSQAGPETEQRARLREAHANNRAAYLRQVDDALHEATKRSRAIDAAIDHLTFVEHSNYDASLLASQPTSARSTASIRRNEVEIVRLNFNEESCSMQCHICCQESAMMSLALKQLDQDTISGNKSKAPSCIRSCTESGLQIEVLSAIRSCVTSAPRPYFRSQYIASDFQQSYQ